MGLGDRHGDEKVRRGLALFKGKFRNNTMPRLLEIARELRKIFGGETRLCQGFGQDSLMCPNEGELGEFGDGGQLVEVMAAYGRLHDERQPCAMEDPGAFHGVVPGAAHAPETVVRRGIQRVEGQRQTAHAFLFQQLGQSGSDAHAVGPDDDPQLAFVGVADDRKDVPSEQRFPAGKDHQCLRCEARDVVDDLAALVG